MAMSNRRRTRLAEDLSREGRRVGSQSLLINHFVADKLGLGQRDYEAIDVLDWAGLITAGRLAELMGVTTGAVTGIVDRLETRGYVTRRRDTDDRRKIFVELRREALTSATQVYAPILQGMQEMVAEMTVEDLEAVVAFMSRFNDMLWDSIQQIGERGG